MIRKMTLATVAILAVSSPAYAEGVTVEYDATRLGEPAYVETFYAKLEAASREACKREIAGSLFYFSALRSCVETTLAKSIEQVGAPMLTAYAEGEALTQKLAAAE